MNPFSNHRYSRTRKFIIECLEPRQLLAADGLAPIVNSFSAEIVNNGEGHFTVVAVDSSNPAIPAGIEWDFGDGSVISNESNPIHVFPAAGQYTVKASLTDIDGIARVQKSIVQVGAFQPIVASYANANSLQWTFATVNLSQVFFQIDNAASFTSSLLHTFDTAGTYDLLIASGTTITMPFVAGNDAPSPPISFQNGIVKLQGTTAADDIAVTQQGQQFRFQVGQTVLSYARNQVVGIEARLDAGDDTFLADARVQVPITVFGGDGNDVLFGGRGNDTFFGNAGDDFIVGNDGDDIIIGNSGNDLLFGGNGDDILIGGFGMDLLFGDQGDDLLIGNTTLYDENILALQMIRSVWTGPGSFANRTLNIRNGTGPVLTGTGIRLRQGVEINDDGTFDLVFGGAGNDWLP